jgi:Anthrone oxygenase
VKIRTAQATTIVLFALVMGVFWGTWFALSRTMNRLSAETFVAVGHEMIRNLGVPMAILLPLALLSALITLVLLWPGVRGAAFWWLLAGFLLMVAALVITLAVEVPIDNQIKVWTAVTLPGDWRSIQSRWEAFHTIRSFLSIAAVVAATISAAVTARPSQSPMDEVSSHGRAIAGARSA